MFEMGYVDSPGDQSAGQWETGLDGAGIAAPAPSSGPHISLAAGILLLIALKAFTESNLISTDLAEIKLSLLNIFAIGVVSIVFQIGFKLYTAWASGRGVALPGQEEIAAAL